MMREHHVLYFLRSYEVHCWWRAVGRFFVFLYGA
jgi:hypothetical protein|uniref:Uncharacterized protein n=1 Tax=uncultured haloarchaeon TaxID=160804 RepID=A0A0K1YBK2_9EURY|nr:hypothetical protein [uncultured haloarchaeon]